MTSRPVYEGGGDVLLVRGDVSPVAQQGAAAVKLGGRGGGRGGDVLLVVRHRAVHDGGVTSRPLPNKRLLQSSRGAVTSRCHQTPSRTGVARRRLL